AGTHNYTERIGGDQVPVLEGDDGVVVALVEARGFDNLILNSASALTGDVKIRQAIQAALDVDPILEAGRGAGYYELYASLMPEGNPWYSDAGGENYDVGDPERASQLLEEAGYDGTPVRILTTQADLTKYNACIVIKQQLEE